MKVRIKSILFFFVLLCFVPMLTNTYGYAQQKDKSQVKISWEEFRKLLRFDTDEISLTWEEFHQLVAQTGEDITIPYTLKDGKVLLPREQFRQLLDKMKPPRQPVLTPPADYVITRAEYSGRMDKNSTTFTALFSLQIFEKETESYREIPFLPKTAALEQVLLDEKPALVIEKNGWYHITTAESGFHRIKALYHVSSDMEKGPQILNLSVTKTAITLFQLIVPLEEIDITVPNAKELTISRETGQTRVNAILPASNYIMVNAHRKYVPKKEVTEDIPAKIYVETINLLSIEEDALRVTCRFKLNVLQNQITHIEAKVPEDYNILYIHKSDGTRLQDWQIKKKDNDSIVDIPFDNPVEGSIVFDILIERLFKTKQTEINFDGFQVPGAIRETGYVGAEKKSTAEAIPVKHHQLDLIDIKDLPYELVSMSKRPLLFGYRYLRHPYNLALSITRHEELSTISTVIDLASVITVVLPEGKRLTKVNYTIRNTWKQFLKLDLPPDSEIWTAYVGGKRENASRNSDGKIMIPLARSQAKGEELESFTVDLIYYSKGNPPGSMGSDTVRFPDADIMISKMLWSLYLPEEYHYLHFSGNVEKEEMASTINLFFGKSRDFSLDKARAYNEVADNLEQAPQQQQVMTGYQKSLQSNFRNRAIGQKDMAQQMRFEANFNVDIQTEQRKRLGKPGSGSNIFKIELPTSGQIFRFNKTVIEGEPVELNFYYASNTLVTIIKVFLILVIILLIFLARKKIFALVRRIYHWFVSRRAVWDFLKTKAGMRTTLFFSSILFWFISKILFTVLVLLFLLSIFRPHWLLRDKSAEDKGSEEKPPEEKPAEEISPGEKSPGDDKPDKKDKE